MYPDSRCHDCRVETCSRDGGIGEWYMVEHHVWVSAMHAGFAHFLCIGCLENRLGRKLTPDDFSLVPLNFMISAEDSSASPRLRDRMGDRFLKPETLEEMVAKWD